MRFQFNEKIYVDLMRRRNDFISGMSRKNSNDISKHMAAVVSKSGEIIAIGYNNVRPNRFSTIHAERDALDKAVSTYYRKYGKSSLQKSSPKVDLVVMRANGTNSRPCYNCITEVINGNQYFNINRIWYSHENAAGGLIDITPSELFQTRHQHISRYNVRRMGLNSVDALAWMDKGHDNPNHDELGNDDGHEHHEHDANGACAGENGVDADDEGEPLIRD